MSENFDMTMHYRYIDRLVCQSVHGVHVMSHNQPEEQYSSFNDVRVETSVSDSCEPPQFNRCPTAAVDCRPEFHVNSKKKPSYQPRNVNSREHRIKLQSKSLQECIKEKDSEIRKLRKLVQKNDYAAEKFQEAVDTTTLKLDIMEKDYQKSQQVSQRKVQKLQKVLDAVLSDCDALEDSSETVQAENECLKSVITAMQNELVTEKDITVKTKSGRYYTPAIRKMYYTLIANQVPATRIRDIVSTIAECFVPDCDVRSIKLPKEK